MSEDLGTVIRAALGAAEFPGGWKIVTTPEEAQILEDELTKRLTPFINVIRRECYEDR